MNTMGCIFRVSLFGESHGERLGAVLDGVTPGIRLSEEDFAEDIARRRSGAKGTTPRVEADQPLIVSGIYEGRTTGAPLAILFENRDVRSGDYAALRDVPRPGHADYTASVKYGGFQDPRGGGHFSGRLTLPVVAAGVVAKKELSEAAAKGRGVFAAAAKLVEVGGCAEEAEWPALTGKAAAEGDSLGGIVECRVSGLPAGLGEPFFDSVESLVSHAVFSIPGVRGIEFGDGFEAARMKGSEHNDPLVQDGGGVLPAKNGSGGVNGGISNGSDLVFRVAFKPTSSIRKPQTTWDLRKEALTRLTVPGRHDVCFALRTPVIVEAMAAIVLADLMKRA